MRNDRIVVDHRRPELSQHGPGESSISQSPLTVEYSYINCTGNTVVISLKNGLRLELKSENSLTTSGFIVRVTYKFPIYVADKLRMFLVNRDLTADDPLHPFKIGLTERPHKQGNRHVVTVEHRVARKSFGMRGGSIFIDDSDVLLTLTDDATKAPMHPHSGEYARSINGGETTGTAFVYKLELIDNNKSMAVKYANINGEVFRIIPTVDPLRISGLYRYCRKPNSADQNTETSYETYYSFEDMAKVGVFDTFDEAVYSGDLGVKKKEELLQAEHQALIKRHETDAAKQEANKNLLQLTADANARKHLQDIELLEAKHLDNLNALKEEERRLRMKDSFDERAYKRKDDSEFMKHLPVIILGAGAALAAIFSLL